MFGYRYPKVSLKQRLLHVRKAWAVLLGVIAEEFVQPHFYLGSPQMLQMRPGHGPLESGVGEVT